MGGVGRGRDTVRGDTGRRRHYSIWPRRALSLADVRQVRGSGAQLITIRESDRLALSRTARTALMADAVCLFGCQGLYVFTQLVVDMLDSLRRTGAVAHQDHGIRSGIL